MGRFFKLKRANREKLIENIQLSDEYILSSTCQITNLSSIYKLLFGYKKEGFFVELGAYDGEYASNTSGLADLGWEGIYIEPVQEYFNKAIERHKNNNVRVVKRAVGDKKGSITINIGGPLSTANGAALQKFKEMEWSKNIITDKKETVILDTLNNILSDNKCTLGFDILSVDVEGYEYNILSKFDFKYWKPKVVIIELHDNNVNYPFEWKEAIQILNILDDSGYRIIYKDFSNTIFVRKNFEKSIK